MQLGRGDSLFHPLVGLKDVRLHYGTINNILLPAVSRINAPAAVDRAKTIGLAKRADLAEAVVALNRDLDLPASLSAIYVPLAWFCSDVDTAEKDWKAKTRA